MTGRVENRNEWEDRRLYSRRLVDSELCRRHSDQLDILNGRITSIEKQVSMIAPIYERQGEIKELLEARRDWQGAKSYGKFVIGVVIGVGTFIGSTVGIMRYVWPRQ